MTTIDTALYIKHKNREWAVWHSPQGELLAIPGDEEPCSNNDLSNLFSYLEVEGFFPDYFSTLEDNEQTF
jgi:hypothetical protein